MSQQIFRTMHQQASAVALALTFTLGTLFSLNMLATPADPAVAMAASAASGAKVVSRSVRAPQG